MPRERTETVRQEMKRELQAGPASARDLSARLRISERDVVAHLEHLRRSLARGEQRLVVEASRCLACDFEFEDRRRLAAPSRCPKCRSERITPPLFWVRTRE